MILRDTNVVSEVMRPAPDPKVRAWFGGVDAAPISTSAVAISEVAYGLARLPDSKRRSELMNGSMRYCSTAPQRRSAKDVEGADTGC